MWGNIPPHNKTQTLKVTTIMNENLNLVEILADCKNRLCTQMSNTLGWVGWKNVQVLKKC